MAHMAKPTPFPGPQTSQSPTQWSGFKGNKGGGRNDVERSKSLSKSGEKKGRGTVLDFRALPCYYFRSFKKSPLAFGVRLGSLLLWATFPLYPLCWTYRLVSQPMNTAYPFPARCHARGTEGIGIMNKRAKEEIKKIIKLGWASSTLVV